jgi:hypothetical protein
MTIKPTNPVHLSFGIREVLIERLEGLQSEDEAVQAWNADQVACLVAALGLGWDAILIPPIGRLSPSTLELRERLEALEREAHSNYARYVARLNRWKQQWHTFQEDQFQ